MSLQGAEEPKSPKVVHIPEGVHVKGVITPWHHQNRISLRIPPDRAGRVIAETADSYIASFAFQRHSVAIEIAKRMLKP